MAFKKVYYFNLPFVVNENFDQAQERLTALEGSVGGFQQAATIAALGTTTAVTTVPGSFADLASVQSYLSGANVIPNINTRLSNLESKVNAIIAALKAAGIMAS